MKIQSKLKFYYFKSRVHHKLCNCTQKYRTSDKQRIWILLGADYGNLGDVAITIFQKRFLQALYENAEVITVPISETLSSINQIKDVIKDTDVVTLAGGGNISDLYEDIEFLRQLIIKSFPKNKIISFPQSMFLTQTPKGDREQKRIARIYGAHQNFIIMMRDQASFIRMRQIVPKGDIRLAPDIVMLGDQRKNTFRKKQVLICIRGDKESCKIGEDKILIISNKLRQKGFDIKMCDTQIEDDIVKRDGGEYHLNKLLDRFRSSSLIITNRLHGMIFAFITGTPAIVFDNSTGKVSSTFEWIKDCGFIQLADENFEFERIEFTDNFQKIISQLKDKFINTLNNASTI